MAERQNFSAMQGEATRTLIRGGVVVTGDTNRRVLMHGDVWIKGEVIERVEASGMSQPGPDCEVIDARGFIVMPGLIDPHRHLWQTLLRGLASNMTAPQYRSSIRAIFGQQFTPEDVYIATLAGALDALDCGITTVLDWSHITNSPEHSDASVAALRASGMRCIYAHGGPNDHDKDLWWSNSARPHQHDAARVRNELLHSDDGLVTMALGVRAPHLVTREVMVHDWNLARELGLRLTIDGGLGGGLWGRRNYPIRLLHDANLMGPDATYIHCNNLAPDEYDLIRDTGGSVCISSCNEMHVGFGTPATGRLLAAGIKPCLSVDSTVFVAGDLFGTMRSTLAVERGVRSQKAFEAGEGIRSWDFGTAEVLEFATSVAAASLGFSQRIGSLTSGLQADVVMLDARSVRLAPVNDPVSTIVLQATPADVDTVMVAGKLLKRRGKLLRTDAAGVVEELVMARNRMFERSNIRMGDDIALQDASAWNW
jgi:5-methylthioadenosine/S-adenosylhomocysteine deaminase